MKGMWNVFLLSVAQWKFITLFFFWICSDLSVGFTVVAGALMTGLTLRLLPVLDCLTWALASPEMKQSTLLCSESISSLTLFHCCACKYCECAFIFCAVIRGCHICVCWWLTSSWWFYCHPFLWNILSSRFRNFTGHNRPPSSALSLALS